MSTIFIKINKFLMISKFSTFVAFSNALTAQINPPNWDSDRVKIFTPEMSVNQNSEA
jgi:hypothetical protein